MRIDTSKPGSTRSVLLRHTLEEGGSHLDWMIERADPAAPLIAFRLALSIELMNASEFAAERMADHRRVYLEYEGIVTGGRDADFDAYELAESEDRFSVVLQAASAGGRRMRWTGERENGPRWRFSGVVC